jgi:hypothetical protein
MADEEICKHLDSISVLFEMASITTIATSPEIFVMQPDWRKAILSKVMRRLNIIANLSAAGDGGKTRSH